MRLRFPRIMTKKKRARIVEAEFKRLDKLGADTKRVNDLVDALGALKGHPWAKKYGQSAEYLAKDLESKAIDAEIAGDRFSQGYYENYAKRLRDAISKSR